MRLGVVLVVRSGGKFLKSVSGMLFGLALILQASTGFAAIVNVVETGGDNEATDTITAKWTGQSFPVSVANEPFTGAVIGETYNVGLFDNLAPSFVDRNHRYYADTTLPIPAYLIGAEYIMSGNDNRDNASYTLDVTVDTPSLVFMLIDNRLGTGDNLTPPTFGAANMQWILDEAWIPFSTGNNRTFDLNVPDEIAFDEGADNTVNQYYSVYLKEVPAGTFTLRQADNAGRNMYGVAVLSVPEPGTLALSAFGLVGLLAKLRRRK